MFLHDKYHQGADDMSTPHLHCIAHTRTQRWFSPVCSVSSRSLWRRAQVSFVPVTPRSTLRGWSTKISSQPCRAAQGQGQNPGQSAEHKCKQALQPLGWTDRLWAFPDTSQTLWELELCSSPAASPCPRVHQWQKSLGRSMADTTAGSTPFACCDIPRTESPSAEGSVLSAQ